MSRCLPALAALAVAVTVAGCNGFDDDATPVACAELTRLELAGARVVSAQVVPAGDFTAPAQGILPATPLSAMPGFCRVVGKAAPSADSDIGFEVWVPANWNGKYMQVGTLAYAGFYPYGPMAAVLKRGYAVASTDTGHAVTLPDLAAWALGHPEKIVDWGWRAHKVTVDLARQIVTSHTARSVRQSYFVGASNGGREGFMLAQRFPELFDGYILDGPANAWTRLSAGWVNTEQAQFTDPASAFGAAKLPAIQAAALAQCDAADGLVDGIVDDPRACRFDPQALLCTGAESDACLTAPQVASLARIVDGPRSPSTGARVFPGYEPFGVDMPDWANYIAGPSLFGVLNGNALLGNATFGDLVRGSGAGLNFDFASIDFDTDVAAASARLIGGESVAAIVDAAGTDFRGLRSKGARIILTTGWEDPVVPPRHVIQYYESVVAGAAFNGDLAAAQAHVRLFMVPGGGHLTGLGAPGAAAVGNPFGLPGLSQSAQHDVVAALEAWVEQGRAPEGFVAAKYVGDDPAAGVQRTRPLCLYPKRPRYQGSGSATEAASFACVDAARGAYPTH